MNDPTFGDDMGLPWWFKLAVVVMVLILLLMVVMVIRAIRLTRRTKAYVAQQGWTYRARDRQLAKRWTGPPFENGHNRRCEDVVEGTYEGWPFLAFTHRYETGSGADESTWNTQIVALLCETSLPDVDVVREGKVGRLMGKMMNFDIQLESEEFNRAYTVKCDDRRFASALLHPRMMDQLMSGSTRESWALRNGDLLDVDNWNGKPDDITRHLDHLLGILRQVPDFLWQDHGGRPHQLVKGAS